MVWALLALLGVPIWLVLGGLGAALWSRKQFQANPDVFPLRVRLLEEGVAGKWSAKMHGRWVHDVFLANTGLALVKTDAYPVVSHGPAPAPDPARCKGLGDHLVALMVTIDDGRVYELATSVDNAALLTLPFDLDATTA